MDTIDQNKNTVTSFIDALFTKGDLGAVDEYLAGEFVNHDPPLGVTADREGMRQAGAMFRAAFPDWHSDMGLLVGEGELVVEHFTATGTQQVRSSACLLRAVPSAFPGSTSGASATDASWSAGGASTTSASCVSSGWCTYPDWMTGRCSPGRL